MTALHNETGEGVLREAFYRQLLRGNNAAYMRQKWGTLKPSQPGQADDRYRVPFNNPGLPLSWWQLDPRRRSCIRDESHDVQSADAHARRPPCPFDAALANAWVAAQARPIGVVTGVPAAGSRFAQRLRASSAGEAAADAEASMATKGASELASSQPKTVPSIHSYNVKKSEL